jgi:glycosyltransferase involved in cell wall biosynthesis
MKEMPLVSIIMPNYNYAKYLQQSINAILAQTYPHFEIIIIDDASTDNSINIIKQYVNQHKSIQLVPNKINKGVVACRNLGIELAKGSYLCFIDPDDFWEKNKLALQIEALENQNANLCFTDLQIIDENGKKGKIRKHFYNEYSYTSLLKRNFIPHSTLIVKKELLEGIRYKELQVTKYQKKIMQKFKINKIIHEDYEFLLTIFKNKKVKAIHIAKPLVNYRIHNNNYSGNYIKKIFSLYCIYKNTQGFSFIQSILYTIRIAFLASIKNLT